MLPWFDARTTGIELAIVAWPKVTRVQTDPFQTYVLLILAWPGPAATLPSSVTCCAERLDAQKIPKTSSSHLDRRPMEAVQRIAYLAFDDIDLYFGCVVRVPCVGNVLPKLEFGRVQLSLRPDQGCLRRVCHSDNRVKVFGQLYKRHEPLLAPLHPDRVRPVPVDASTAPDAQERVHADRQECDFGLDRK